MEDIIAAYERFCESKLTHRRFKHEDIKPLLVGRKLVSTVIGTSYEGRDIYQLRYGTGPIKVLLWSQMHGNEATATMALFDIFNFLESIDFKDFKDEIDSQLSLYFVPMLNPDGAERFIRRTAQQIDMNRDALNLVCPESKLLAQLQHELKPNFSFNLHDQDVKYAAGNTPNQAAISFLATAYNQDRSWNKNRTRAAQVIVEMNKYLQQLVPNRVGKFSDEFEPRAFGDNIQKWGSSLILIESGGNGEDREKMELRKLNFAIILHALHTIATGSFAENSIEDYQSIPENTRCLFDLLIRNVRLPNEEKIDIGINLIENNNSFATDFKLSSVIEDLGDLSVFWGIKELDAEDMIAEPFKKFPELMQEYEVKGENSEGVKFEEKAYFVLVKENIVQYAIVDGIVLNRN